MKFFTKIAALAVLGAFSISAHAQGQIKGYFRVQNAHTGNYVEVTGPFSGAPDQSFEAAQSKAGTVIYVEAEQDETGKAYEITELRSQGINVVGDYEADYKALLQEIMFTGESFDTSIEALWKFVRGGFKYGYTTVGRAAIQFMIYIVAERLEQEKEEGKDFSGLADFADKFNDEVSQYIDLGLRLEPVNEGHYRLYYETPDLQAVSDFYEGNKETFGKGFDAMRHYLKDKIGVTGEGLEPYEIAEMQSWGYNPEENYGEFKNDEGVIVLSYEKIFADPELLFNWLKLNVIKFTDPERCPDIELRGISLLAFANEMQKHALTKQIISYFPKLQTNQRIYLTDGKYGVEGHFDFTSLTGANDLGDYAEWVLCPIDNENQKFFATTTEVFNEKNYGAVYYDFPVAAMDGTTFYGLSEKEEKNGYNFVTKEEMEEGKAGLQTFILIESDEANPQLTVVNDGWTISDLVSGVTISNDKAQNNKQYSNRKKLNEAEEEFNPFIGVLLGSNVDNLENYLGIDLDVTPVYAFAGVKSILGQDHLVFDDAKINYEYLKPNTALYTNEGYLLQDVLVIDAPEIEITVNDTDSGHEDGEDVPEAERVKVAQAFNGQDMNHFKDLINVPSEVDLEKDIVITIKPHDTLDELGTTPDGTNKKLEEAYRDALPAEVFAQYSDIVGGGILNEDMHEDFVDGFFLPEELHQTTSLDNATEDGVGGYDIDLYFDAPCSGVYEIMIEPGEDASLKFTPVSTKVKIVPNLYAKYGKNKEAGFNINGYSYTQEGGNYVIYFPKQVKNEDDEMVAYDLTNCVAYIPGIYFASKLEVAVPGASTQQFVRKSVAAQAEEGNDYVYWADKLDLSKAIDTDEPINVTIEKNGVDATYPFYLKTTENQDDLNTSTGIEGIGTDDVEAVYYNLHGVKVENPEKGVYVKVSNGKAVKVIL